MDLLPTEKYVLLTWLEYSLQHYKDVIDIECRDYDIPDAVVRLTDALEKLRDLPVKV